MKVFTAVLLSLFTLQISAADHEPAGVVEMFDFNGSFGTLTRAASGVPRAKPSPALEAIDRWRASADAFTHGFAMSRGANGTETFKTRRVYEDEIGQAHIRVSQTIAGLPVVGAELIVHVDGQTGNVLGVNGTFGIDRGLARSPKLRADDALAAAMDEYGLAAAHVQGSPELTYIIDRGGNVRLAWTNLVSYTSDNGHELDRIYSDAATGAAIARNPQVRRVKNRSIYDCGNSSGAFANCVFLFGEGGSSTDPKAMAAYNNAGIVWDYFQARHARNGVDGAGGVLKQGINYASDAHCCGGWIDNYTGIVYTDNFGGYVQPESYSLDVVAHEFTHGVINAETSLDYSQTEMAAIHEGLADVFAIAVDHDYDVNSPDWWIAEDIYTVNTANDAMRYVDDPGRRSNYNDYYPTRDDDGIYENSGIVGLAFNLFVEGGGHPRWHSDWGFTLLPFVDPQGMLKGEKVFYRAIATYMTSNTNFRRLRDYTIQAATDLYGLQTIAELKDAWFNVGNDWKTQQTTLGANAEWTSSSYTVNSFGYHTAHYTGSGSFVLSLQKKNSSGAWVTQVSTGGLDSVKSIEHSISSGVFRWRVTSAANSGSFTLHTNRPF